MAITSDECLRKFGHDWVVKPGGARQTNPFTGRPSTMKRKDCSRCETTEMWFEDDEEEDDSDSSSDGGENGGCTCFPSSTDPYCPVHGWM